MDSRSDVSTLGMPQRSVPNALLNVFDKGINLSLKNLWTREKIRKKNIFGKRPILYWKEICRSKVSTFWITCFILSTSVNIKHEVDI